MGVAALAIDRNTSDEELQDLASEFEMREPQQVLRWALEEFGNDVALATGFGAEGCVLVHMRCACFTTCSGVTASPQASGA